MISVCSTVNMGHELFIGNLPSSSLPPHIDNGNLLNAPYSLTPTFIPILVFHSEDDRRSFLFSYGRVDSLFDSKCMGRRYG